MTATKYDECFNCVYPASIRVCKKQGMLPAGGFADSSIRLYALDRGSNTDADMNDGRSGASPSAPGVTHLLGHSAAVYGVDYSSDGQLLFSASGDGCASKMT